MSDRQLEIGFLLFCLALYATVAAAPCAFFRVLGRGRVSPSPRSLTVMRLGSVACMLGVVYYLVYRLGWP